MNGMLESPLDRQVPRDPAVSRTIFKSHKVDIQTLRTMCRCGLEGINRHVSRLEIQWELEAVGQAARLCRDQQYKLKCSAPRAGTTSTRYLSIHELTLAVCLKTLGKFNRQLNTDALISLQDFISAHLAGSVSSVQFHPTPNTTHLASRCGLFEERSVSPIFLFHEN